MEHGYWVVDELLAGRTGPTIAPWNLRELREGGVQVIVSLSEEEDSLEVAEAGLRHCVFGLPPVLILTEEDREVLLEGLEAALPIIHAEVNAGRPVLVHCHAGKDRTGAMLACYLMRYRGLTADEAIQRVRAVRSDAMSAPGYEEAVRRFGEREAR